MALASDWTVRGPSLDEPGSDLVPFVEQAVEALRDVDPLEGSTINERIRYGGVYWF